MGTAFIMAGAAAWLPVQTVAVEAPPPSSELVVTAPMDPRGLEADRLPEADYAVDGDDLRRSGGYSVQQALSRLAPGVSLTDVQGARLGADVDFHGFRASPLQGASEGLAVYQNGVRLNEAFGDTVNWDLVPQVAIRRIDLVTGNPAFGLNAIGGAVAVQMKDGNSAQGGSATLQGGSFGSIAGAAETSSRWRDWALYLAADGEHEHGWRLQSPSTAGRVYGDLGWSRGRSEAHLTLSLGADRFGVVGPTPADLLQQDRAAVYTYPQTTRNHAAMATLAGRTELDGGWSLHASAYLRGFDQRHVDGNNGEFVPCRGLRDAANGKTLCVDGGGLGLDADPAALQVLGPDGAPIACATLADTGESCRETPYGTLDSTHTRALTFGAAVEADRDVPLLGRRNDLALGASVDRSHVRFSAQSRLALIEPDLEVTTQADVPGAGQVIHTAGDLAYSPVDLSDEVTYLGLYARDTLDLTSALSLTAGARMNQAWASLQDRTGHAAGLDGRRQFSRVNLAFGGAYRFSPGLNAFGGYAQANRIPTPLELGCSDPARPCLLEGALVADPPLKQVVAHSWQAGFRGRRKIHGVDLTWSASAFTTTSDNDIVSLASPIQGRGYFANAPRTRRRGFDLATALTARRWSAYASFGRVEATYGFDGLMASPNNPSANPDGDVEVHPGDRIGGIPSGSLKLGGDLSISSSLTLGADLTRTGSQRLVGDEAEEFAPLPAYTLIGLHAAWQATPQVQLFARVDNLFDSRAASYGGFFETDALDRLTPSPLPADPDPRTLTPVTPRAITAGVQARW